jgi:hypothetical protein
MMLGRVCNLYGLSLFLIYIHAILLLEKKEILRPRIGSSELRRLMTSTLQSQHFTSAQAIWKNGALLKCMIYRQR